MIVALRFRFSRLGKKPTRCGPLSARFKLGLDTAIAMGILIEVDQTLFNIKTWLAADLRR